MWEINQDLIDIFNKVLAVVVLQKYTRTANNAKREILVAAYQRLENH